MFTVPLSSVGQRKKRSVLSRLSCLAAILPPNRRAVFCSSQRRVGFEFSNCTNHWLEGKTSHERGRREISSFPTRHNPGEFFPHPQDCLEQVGEGGVDVHSLGNYFSLHVCILLRWQGPLDERPPPHLHTCSRSQTTKQERALGVEQAGALKFHWATWQSQKDSDPQQNGTGLKCVGKESNTRENHWPKQGNRTDRST